MNGPPNYLWILQLVLGIWCLVIALRQRHWFGVGAFAFLILVSLWLLTGCDGAKSQPQEPPKQEPPKVQLQDEISEPRLPPWTIVCSKEGTYSYTDDMGLVMLGESDTREDADRRMERLKEWVAQGRPKNDPDLGWHPCPE